MLLKTVNVLKKQGKNWETMSDQSKVRKHDSLIAMCYPVLDSGTERRY